MNVLKNPSNLLNAKNLGVALFAVTGVHKTYKDYKEASADKRKSVLKRDLTILAGTATGLTAYNLARKGIVKSKLYNTIKSGIKDKINNFIKSDFGKKIFKSGNGKVKSVTTKIVKDSIETLKDCTDNILMVTSGLVGAIGTSNAIKAVYKYNKQHKPEKIDKLNKNDNINNNVEKVTTQNPEEINTTINNLEEITPKERRVSNFEIFANNLRNNSYNYVNQETQRNLFSNLATMPEMKLFSNSMVGLQSFEVMQEKSFANQVKKATNNIITGTLVPVFYLSLATNLTKGLKHNILRFPFVFASMAAATMYTNKKIEPRLEKMYS